MGLMNTIKKVLRRDSILRSSGTSGNRDSGQKERHKVLDWKPGDAIDIKMLDEAWRNNPKGRILIELMPFVTFHGGFSGGPEDEPWEPEPLKLKEIYNAVIWSRVYRWAVLVFDGSNVDAYHPLIDGIGAAIKEFDAYGNPIKIEISSGEGDPIPFEKGSFLFVPSTRLGRKSRYQGDSELLAVYNYLVLQRYIAEYYGYYAGLMGTAIYVKGDDSIQNSTDADNASDRFDNADPTTGVGIGTLTVRSIDQFKIEHPMSGTWDPVPYLLYIDSILASYAKLNKHIFTGDPEGHLSSSQVSSSLFFTQCKIYGEDLFPYLKQALIRIGAPDNVRFNDPTEMPPAAQAELLASVAAMLKSIAVPNDEIVEYINRTMGENFNVNEDAELLRKLPDWNAPMNPEQKSEEIINAKQKPPKRV